MHAIVFWTPVALVAAVLSILAVVACRCRQYRYQQRGLDQLWDRR